jgi:single-stranded DNA-binding protein
LAGFVGRDPFINETRKSAVFSIAVDWYAKDKATQESIRHVDWFDVTCYGTAYHYCHRGWIHKGDSIVIRGRLKARSYMCVDRVMRMLVGIICIERPQVLTMRPIEELPSGDEGEDTAQPGDEDGDVEF